MVEDANPSSKLDDAYVPDMKVALKEVPFLILKRNLNKLFDRQLHGLKCTNQILPLHLRLKLPLSHPRGFHSRWIFIGVLIVLACSLTLNTLLGHGRY